MSRQAVTDFDALGINAAEVEAAYAEFDTLLKEYFENYSFEPGARLVGTVLNVSKRGAQVDIGAKLPAFCPASEASLVPTTKIKSVLVPGMRRWFEIIPRGGTGWSRKSSSSRPLLPTIWTAAAVASYLSLCSPPSCCGCFLKELLLMRRKINFVSLSLAIHLSIAMPIMVTWKPS